MTGTKFSLVDLGKLSKPITKLIDAVSQGIGTIYEPTKIRRKAKAQSDASLIKAEGDIRKKELLKRAANRLAFQEMRRQENIENIVEIAAASLPETVSDEPVDTDWISRFFEDSKDVSNEELQKIWGRLLAGEVTSPGSCSRKTLTILKDLSPLDANLFIKICGFIFASEKNYFIPYDCIDENYFEKYGISTDDFLHLATLDLLHVGSTIETLFINMDELKYFNLNFSCYTTSGGSISIYPITQYGIELLSISNPEPNWTFFDACVKMFSDGQIYLACPLVK